MSRRSNSPEKRKRSQLREKTTVKWRLFFCMMAFSGCVIALLWVMQILFFDEFYYRTTERRMHFTCDQLFHTSTDHLEEKAEELAVKRQFSLLIFQVDDNTYKPTELCNNILPGSALKILRHDDRQLNSIYSKACNEKNGYMLHFNLTENGQLVEVDPPGITPWPSDAKGDLLSERMTLAVFRRNSEGKLLYMLMDASLAPVATTVSTLRLQLVVLSCALFVISVIIALSLSVHLSRPLRKLNAAAKELAAGNYAADFQVDGGYCEVNELSETLTYAADELGKVDRLQKELLANISHDLRTPLTMIIGYGEIMRDLEGENTPENVQVIIDEATRLSSLVNDLLEISSYQAGNEGIAREPFDLSSVVRDVCQRYQHLKERSGYTVTFEGDDGVLIFADKKRILQVVCNLINNAINYAGEDKAVIVRCARNEGNVRLSVIDHGAGIPQQELGNIWNRYYKVNKNHVRGVTGSGLGLSIVRRILELHGARYGVSSQVNAGSCFWFELPEYTQESLPFDDQHRLPS